MRTIDARLQLAIAVLCICMPVYESHILINRYELLARTAELHVLTALALCLAALFVWSPRYPRTPRQLWVTRVGLLSCALLNVLVQYVQGADYRMLSLMQPFHVLSVAFIAWVLGSMTTTCPHALWTHAVARFGPLTVVWGVCALWSPLVAVYADSLSGGDRVIGHATTAMLVFAASLTIALRQTTQQFAPRGVVVVGFVMFALSQALMSTTMRFVPLMVLCGLFFEVLRVLRPTTPRVTVFATVLLWVIGYFGTLHLTTRIAWDLTAWLGVCVLSACVATALCIVQYQQSGDTV